MDYATLVKNKSFYLLFFLLCSISFNRNWIKWSRSARISNGLTQKNLHFSSMADLGNDAEEGLVNNKLEAFEETEGIDLNGEIMEDSSSFEDIDMVQRKIDLTEDGFNEFNSNTNLIDSIEFSNNSSISECDYYRGQWIQDDSLSPSYNYKNCSFLLSFWMCQKYPRPNFDYLRYKWKPVDCELPVFNANDFLLRTSNKMIGFIGDSLTQQHFKSLVCLLSTNTLGSKRLKLGNVFGFYQAKGANSPNGLAYKFLATNTTVLFIGNSFLGQMEDYVDELGRNRTAIHLDKPDSVLVRNFHRLSVFVAANTNKFNEQGFDYDYFLNGTKIGNRNNVTAHYATIMVIRTMANYLDSETKRIEIKEKKPLIFFRTFSPSHYLRGTNVKGGSCSQYQEPLDDEEIKGRSYRDWVVENATLGTELILFNITKMSTYRADAHPAGFYTNQSTAKQDCRHWCMPGIPDAWNQLLYIYIIGGLPSTPPPPPPPALVPASSPGPYPYPYLNPGPAPGPQPNQGPLPFPNLAPSPLSALSPVPKPALLPNLVPATLLLPKLSPLPSTKPSPKPSPKPPPKPALLPPPKKSPKPPLEPFPEPPSKPFPEPPPKTSPKPPSKPSLEPPPKSLSKPPPSTLVTPPTKPPQKPPPIPSSKPPPKPSNPPPKPSLKPPSKPSSTPPSILSSKPPHKPSSKPPPKPSLKPPSEPSSKPPPKPSSTPPSIPSSTPPSIPSSKPPHKPSSKPPPIPSKPPSEQSSKPPPKPSSKPPPILSSKPPPKPSSKPPSKLPPKPSSDPPPKPSSKPPSKPSSKPPPIPSSKPPSKPSSKPPPIPISKPPPKVSVNLIH